VLEEPLDIPPDPGEPHVREPALREPPVKESALGEQHLREQPLREAAPEAPHVLIRNMGRSKREPVKFKFDLQYGYIIVECIQG
jgi:hypothetical protein